MTYEEFNKFCDSLPETTHVVQWGNSDVWKVGGKVFAIGGWEPNDEPAFVFKASDMNYVFLSESEGYRPAPYFATRGMKWIQQIDNTEDNEEDLKYYLKESHRLVSLGLTKKKQRELGLNQEES
ncbi:MmcQ/YjbR family DNA-binding protein [Pseudomonadota bacterium]